MTLSLDFERFWRINQQCLDDPGKAVRVPVGIHLDGDWICDCLKLDNAKYYSDFEYQQEHRLRCSEITMREIGYRIQPDVDFGVVMDASVYGGEVHYEPNATPTLRPVVQDPEDIDGLVEKMSRVDPLECGLVPKYLEWREKIKSRYGISMEYGGAIKGCATMLGQLCGITNFLTWVATDPEQIEKLIACWFETSLKYIRAMRTVTGFPADRKGFGLYSDVAGMLSPGMYRDLIMDAEKKLYDAFAPETGDPRFYHADSHMHHHLETFREMGVNQVNIDPYIDPAQILEKMPDVTVFGQIPPLKVLLYGTPEEVIACAKRDIEQAGPGRHLVLTTAGSINPGTSFENLKALCFAAETYGYIY